MLKTILKGAALGTAVVGFMASAQAADPVKVGVMLPYTGTYAALGEAITNGMKMAIEDAGGTPGGRAVEYVVVDDESEPGKAPGNMEKLVSGSNVDMVVGTVHSGVAMGMLKVAREKDAILLIPNAGFNAATGPLCAPNVFRTSFTSWQTAYPMGKAAAEKGFKKVATITWKYGFGEESVEAFKEGFEAAGGEVVEEITLPFPDVEFQAQLTRLAQIKPDAVFAFFAGGGAVKFVKDYAAAGLAKDIPLIGSGFLTDGTLAAQGAAAEGIMTTLHYADTLDNPTNRKFREAYKAKFGKEADIYAVQGYDTGLVIAGALDATKGDTSDRQALLAAIRGVTVDSPRGQWTFSPAQNPVQDIYLRQVKDGQNVMVGVAAEDLADPARGCKMM